MTIWAASALLLASSGSNAGPPPAPALSPRIPHDAVLTTPATLENRQRDFDLLSWKSFVALNWPANAGADKRNGNRQAVWETYLLNTQVIKANGEEPDAWGAPQPIPAACKRISTATPPARVLQQTSKASGEILSQFGQALEMGPLVDRNGKLVRYEIRMNRPAYEFIKRTRTYNREGQRAFSGEVSFPEGDNESAEVGAITIKAAWKELGKGDEPARFHTTEAYIYTPPSADSREKESCRIATMGLVGLHISHKTKNAPQWAWATFEHVDNAPTFPAAAKRHYSFYNPAAPDAPVNVAPPRPWTSDRRDYPPTQVMRMSAIAEPTASMNKTFQAAYRKLDKRSAWQNYELVSTQWPTEPRNPRDPLGPPEPPFLANTTMETYIQGMADGGKVTLVPQATSSCIHCHGNATMTTAKPSDFAYLLSAAKERK